MQNYYTQERAKLKCSSLNIHSSSKSKYPFPHDFCDRHFFDKYLPICALSPMRNDSWILGKMSLSLNKNESKQRIYKKFCASSRMNLLIDSAQ